MQKSQNSDLIGYSKCTASAPFPGKTLQQFIPATPFDKLAKLGRLDSSTSCHEEPEGLCTRHFLPSKSKIGVGGITDYSVSSTFFALMAPQFKKIQSSFSAARGRPKWPKGVKQLVLLR